MRTPAPISTISGLGLLVALVSGCGQSQDTAYVRDDVYDRPDPRTVTAAVMAEEQAAPGEERSDYYDAGEAERYANPRGYYDMAYNDPYYYGYDRFGFGTGYGSQWGYNSWSNGYGYGNAWGDPYANPYGGYGSCWGNAGYGMGWNSGYGSGWYTGYGCGCGNNWNSPYNYGGYNGYGYYGYGGGCYNCYQPIVNGGEGWGGGVVYAHRPSFGGGINAGGSSTGAQTGQRMNDRDQVSLLRPLYERERPSFNNSSTTTRPIFRTTEPDQRPMPSAKPQERPTISRHEREVRERNEIPQRNGNDRTIDLGRNTGGGSGGGNSGGRRPR